MLIYSPGPRLDFRTVVDILDCYIHQGHAWISVLSSIFFGELITRATPGFPYCRRYFRLLYSPGPRLDFRTVVDILDCYIHQGHAWISVLLSIFYVDLFTWATPGFPYCRRYFILLYSPGPRLDFRTVVDIFWRINHQGHAWISVLLSI